VSQKVSGSAIRSTSFGRAALTSRAAPRNSASSDIALLPEYCNRGIGTTLLRTSEAATAGKPLRIHVERFNPALRLYERLGFTPIAGRGVYLFMEWRAGIDDPELVI
jgi:ribosomal protein S18 acetylase RimI-like enzyme